MDYQKTLKKRLLLAVSYLLLGAVFLVLSRGDTAQQETFSCFGLAFSLCGIVRILRHYRLVTHPERMKQAEIAERDERNILIWTKARSLAFTVYLSLSGTAVIVLHLMQRSSEAIIVAYTVCAFVFIYWICYLIVRRNY